MEEKKKHTVTPTEEVIQVPLVETVRVTAEEQKKEEKEVFKIDKDTVLFMLYLQFKANMFTRRHLKDFLKIIDEPMPENVAKFIVTEAARAE